MMAEEAGLEVVVIVVNGGDGGSDDGGDGEADGVGADVRDGGYGSFFGR